MSRPRSIPGLIGALALGACSTETSSFRETVLLGQQGSGSPKALEPFTQEVPGTAVSLDLVAVPAGAVAAPSASGEKQVEVGPFWISRTEVPWDLYDVFIYGWDQPGESKPSGADALARPSKPYIMMDRGFGHAGYPVISVSYRAAQAFCTWLSARSGRTYRLPTEAEWRHVCALSGIGAATVADYAWYDDTADFTTHPVGKKKADALGLHDLVGNAAEWCTDLDGHPVTIGGSFRDGVDDIGCGARVPPSDDWNASDPQIPKSVWWLADAGFVGFRVVCVPGEPPAANESTRP